VHELLAERNGELLELGRAQGPPQPGDRDEEVQDLGAQVVRAEPGSVAAAQDPGHDGFRHARGECGRDGGVRGAAAVLEDLEARLGGRRMARRYAGGYEHLC
jgi:hypothetical protein